MRAKLRLNDVVTLPTPQPYSTHVLPDSERPWRSKIRTVSSAWLRPVAQKSSSASAMLSGRNLLLVRTEKCADRAQMRPGCLDLREACRKLHRRRLGIDVQSRKLPQLRALLEVEVRPPGGELRRAHQCRRELQLVLRAEMRVNGLRRLRIPPQKESVAPGYGFCRNSHFRSPRLRQPFPSASAVSPRPAAGSRCCAWRRHWKETRPTAGGLARAGNAPILRHLYAAAPAAPGRRRPRREPS